jgi:L-ascorbate metabolism protein UlaG (beta-lactamase superfamily)
MDDRRLAGIMQWQVLFGFLIVVLGMALTGISKAQEPAGPCEPAMVQHTPWRPIVRVAFTQTADTTTGVTILEWLGHSSFLLTSPGGTHLLTDPNAWHPTSVTPHAVTISNLHTTHRMVEGIAGKPQLLWGVTPTQTLNRIAVSINDITIFNVPSYAGRDERDRETVQNSMFVFRTGGLCFIHLGNLRHPLTTEQLQRIGRPDVVMVPVEGFLNLSLEEILLVIRQLQPLLVIPMHIETPEQARIFTASAATHHPVRRIAGRRLILSRNLLPNRTEIVQFEDS